jgi:hypothetical protein
MYVSEFRLEDYPVSAEDVLHVGKPAVDDERFGAVREQARSLAGAYEMRPQGLREYRGSMLRASADFG